MGVRWQRERVGLVALLWEDWEAPNFLLCPNIPSRFFHALADPCTPPPTHPHPHPPYTVTKVGRIFFLNISNWNWKLIHKRPFLNRLLTETEICFPKINFLTVCPYYSTQSALCVCVLYTTKASVNYIIIIFTWIIIINASPSLGMLHWGGGCEHVTPCVGWN